MTAPADREFRAFLRGYVRDVILQYFGQGLRLRANPETGALFTEDEIAAALAPGSRWWRQAQAIDDYAQGEQRRALFMNDQLRIDRACTAWLAEYHGKQWDPEGKLAATSSSGTVRVTAPTGTIVIGSTTIGDDSAYWGRDELGNRFQVDVTTTVPEGSSYVDLTMVCMDPGTAGNIRSGSVITWQNRDPAMSPTATVGASAMSGGTNIETDEEWSSRMLANIRWKQGAGNDPQFRAWARECSNAIEDAFIYPCALHANSVVVCITQKRGGLAGPLARIPNNRYLAQAIAYLTPPNSPVVPTPPLVIVVAPQSQPVAVGLRVEMERGSSNGWTDPTPFPAYSASGCAQVSSVASSSFVIRSYADATLPGQSAGATVNAPNCPHIMVWDVNASQFVDLKGLVTSIQDLQTNPPTYRVTLNITVPASIVAGEFVSPGFANSKQASDALNAYFDERGPGDLFVSTDIRADRCVRFPEFTEDFPAKIGADVAQRVIDALEGQTINATAPAELMPVTAPYYPSSPLVGPYMLTLGEVGIYPL